MLINVWTYEKKRKRTHLQDECHSHRVEDELGGVRRGEYEAAAPEGEPAHDHELGDDHARDQEELLVEGQLELDGQVPPSGALYKQQKR